MAIEGTYTVETKTPMGIMQGKMVLTVDGAKILGNFTSKMGAIDIDGISPAADEITFNSKISSPFGKIAAKARITISGDDVSGQIDAGLFGKFLLTGKRV